MEDALAMHELHSLENLIANVANPGFLELLSLGLQKFIKVALHKFEYER